MTKSTIKLRRRIPAPKNEIRGFMRNLLWAVLVLSLSASAQKVTWQQINVPGTNQTITAMNNLGDMVGTTWFDWGTTNEELVCFLRSRVDGSITIPLMNHGYPAPNCSGINDHGAIIGNVFGDLPAPFGILYYQGTSTYFHYPETGEFPFTFLYGINDAGTMVGNASSNGNPVTSFYLYQGKLPYKKYSLSSWGYTGDIYLAGINNNGTFFGSASIGGNFLSNSAGPPVLISTLGGGVVTGVNTKGEITGYYTNNKNNLEGFLIENGISKTILYPGSVLTLPYAIDDYGNIAGEMSIDGSTVVPFVRWVKCTPKIGCQ
jgi:hypothetical protein